MKTGLDININKKKLTPRFRNINRSKNLEREIWHL
jgi:ribosomal protein S30